MELAELVVDIVPSAEMVRFVKNGSDATASAIRLARAYTVGIWCWRAATTACRTGYIGTSENNLGVPQAVQQLIKTFPYNDADALAKLLDEHSGKVAAIIMEPVRTEEPRPG